MPKPEIVPVNARLPVPEAAAESLRRLYGAADAARQSAEAALLLVCQALEVDVRTVVAFDGDKSELVLEELDPARMPEAAMAD